VGYTDTVVEFLRRVAQAYGSLGLAVQAGIVLALALLTTAFGVAMVVSMPADHFKADRPRPVSWWRNHALVYGVVMVVKNTAGVVLVALGGVMALPLVPGPGFVFILLGFGLLDFPGKRNVERRLLALPNVIPRLNQVRARFGKPPLMFDGPDAAPGRHRAS